jgi:DNA-binding transcriptional ArsR family regulator
VTSMAPGDDIGASVNEWIAVFRRARFPAGLLTRGKGRVSEATVKAVGGWLADYANPDGTSIHPGEYRLMVELDLSRGAVQRAMRVLREAGLMEVTSRGGRKAHKADTYRLILAADLLDRIEVRSPDQVRAEAARLAAGFYASLETHRNGSMPPAAPVLCLPRDAPPSLNTLPVSSSPSPHVQAGDLVTDRNAHARGDNDRDPDQARLAAVLTPAGRRSRARELADAARGALRGLPAYRSMVAFQRISAVQVLLAEGTVTEEQAAAEFDGIVADASAPAGYSRAGPDRGEASAAVPRDPFMPALALTGTGG